MHWLFEKVKGERDRWSKEVEVAKERIKGEVNLMRDVLENYKHEVRGYAENVCWDIVGKGRVVDEK